MSYFGMILYSLFLPGTVTLEGSAINTEGERIPNVQIILEYKTGNSSDREFYAYAKASTDLKGNYSVKLQRCWRNKPIRIVAFSRDYQPVFYQFTEPFKKKNSAFIIFTKTCSRKITYDLKSNSTSSSLKEENLHFIVFGGDKIAFSNTPFESSFLKLLIRKKSDSLAISIKPSANNKIFPIAPSETFWLYSNVTNKEVADILVCKASKQLDNSEGCSFILKINESIEYRCLIKYLESDTNDGSYTIDFIYSLEKLNSEYYYYYPKDYEDTRRFFELIRNSNAQF